ncbi:MAG: AAA family ATPase [Cellvibrionales bacterium]|nr:AAA family ATPase [Cellvibrionales bacterium]
MPKTFLIAPVGLGVGASSVCAAIIKTALENGLPVGFFLPVKQRSNTMGDFLSVQPVLSRLALAHFLHQSEDHVVNELVEAYKERLVNDRERLGEVTLVLGLSVDKGTPNAEKINAKLARALSAEVILVGSGTADDLTMLNSRLDIAMEAFGLVSIPVVGIILNKLGAPRDRHGTLRPEKAAMQSAEKNYANLTHLPVIQEKAIPLLGAIPWSIDLIAPKVTDLDRFFSIVWLNEGNKSQRIRNIHLGCSLDEHFDQAVGNLLVTTADRLDLIEAALNQASHISGILLSGGLSDLAHESHRRYLVLKQAKQLSVPILQSHEPLLSLVWQLQRVFNPNPSDNALNAQVQDFCSAHLDTASILAVLTGLSHKG